MDHQAFAQLLGNYGEFVGAVAVVVTLGYLANQVRQQRLESRARSVHEILWGFRDAQAVFADPEVAELGSRLVQLENTDSLTDVELFRVINMLVPLFRVWEEAFHYHKDGRLDSEVWDAIAAQNLLVLGMGVAREVWTIRRQVFTQSFAACVDSLEKPSEYRFR